LTARSAPPTNAQKNYARSVSFVSDVGELIHFIETAVIETDDSLAFRFYSGGLFNHSLNHYGVFHAS
jgi:hypothetical protein